MGLTLTKVKLVELGCADNSHGSAVLLNTVEVSLVRFWVLVIDFIAVSIVFEGSLLSSMPILVESTFNISVDLSSPDCGKGAESTWSFNVSNATNNFHWRAFNNGSCVYNVLLDDLLTFSALLVLDNVSHTGLVAHEGSQVDWFRLVIFWPVSNATTMVLSSSLWEVGKRTLPWVLELSMRH